MFSGGITRDYAIKWIKRSFPVGKYVLKANYDDIKTTLFYFVLNYFQPRLDFYDFRGCKSATLAENGLKVLVLLTLERRIYPQDYSFLVPNIYFVNIVSEESLSKLFELQKFQPY